MALDYKDTVTLLAAYEEKKAPTTFLQSRYFPDGVVFKTSRVLVEYKDGNQKLAPFVAPEIGGKVVKRDGYTAEAYKPAFIAPKRTLTVDDLKDKGFGEALYGDATEEERALLITADDLVDMDEMIVRRHEEMCSQVLQTNSLSMKHYTDDNKLSFVKNIAYYTESSNPAIYTPSISWDKEGAKFEGDVSAIAQILTSRGLPAEDVLMGSNVADLFLDNEKILNKLDNRNYNFGTVDPTEQFPEATFLGRFNFKGKKLNVFTYEATFEDDNGEIKPYIDPDTIIVTAPACGVTNYGAITQIDHGSTEFTTYAKKRVPLYGVKDQVRTIALRTAPLVQPKNKNAAISAKVIF